MYVFLEEKTLDRYKAFTVGMILGAGGAVKSHFIPATLPALFMAYDFLNQSKLAKKVERGEISKKEKQTELKNSVACYVTYGLGTALGYGLVNAEKVISFVEKYYPVVKEGLEKLVI